MSADNAEIYLDHHATTPTDQQVVDVMESVFTTEYGNPASRTNHKAGQDAHELVSTGRHQLMDALGATRSEEIIFTSGATESDNLALKGAMREAQKQGKGNHLITAVTEHEAVLEACESLEKDGYEVTILPVDEHGLVDPDDVEAAICDDTVLVSIMAANNEVGTIAPLEEIGQITSEHDVLFHTDAVQAVGYVDLDVDSLNLDMVSISGHKIYGPKGVGALYVRYGAAHLEPLFHGGGHERGWRSGTLNVPGITGLGKAIELAVEERPARTEDVESLRDHFQERLLDEVDDVVVNGHPEQRLPNNLNMSILGTNDQRLVARLSEDGVYAATGSACSTMETTESHVLTAMYDDQERIQSSIRFGFGKGNTMKEVDEAVDIVKQNVKRLRKFSSF